MKKIKYWVYRFLAFLLKLLFPKFQVVGAENLASDGCIIAGNHCQTNGPVYGQLYHPRQRSIWCAAEMTTLKDIPAYAYKDFWGDKPGWIRWIFKPISYLIAPFAACVFSQDHIIPVYRNQRITVTLRQTLNALKDGQDVIIFPEHDEPYDHILQGFQPGFVDVARSYYRQTGKRLSFVPMYLAPKLKTAYLLAPIQFDPEAPIKEERERICCYLMATISAHATSLPRHKVICYRKKLNTYNRPLEENSHEKAGS